MEKGNFEGFFPLIFIILFYLILHLRKSMKKKERAEITQPPLPPKPTLKPPPVEVVPTIKKVEEPVTFLPRQRSIKKQTRIKKIVGRLHSKKDLIFITEILARRNKF